MTGKLGFFGVGYTADIFFKMNEMSLSLQNKYLTVFVANDKIQASMEKFRFLKTCIHDHELDSSSILTDFSDNW